MSQVLSSLGDPENEVDGVTVVYSRGMYPVYFGFIPVLLYNVPCSAINGFTVASGNLKRERNLLSFHFYQKRARRGRKSKVASLALITA